mgnify:CR=1 FL=1
MAMVIRVRFKRAAKLYDFDPNGLDLHNGMSVVTETARGVELGECMSGVMDVPDERLVLPLKPIIRIATEQDLEIQRRNEQAEKEAFDIALDRIAEHKLEMKLVDVEYAFDHSKIIFYFTANGRVDFRMLVKSLASIFKTRIELRQIGVRDEAKMLGGIGPCGRPICCRTFLSDFTPVSIKMAKEQNLSLNPTKISGLCDRLMCCLKYEQDNYEQTRKRMPRVGREIITPDGVGVINAINVLEETVRVRIAVGDSFELREYRIDDCQRPNQDNAKPPRMEEMPEEEAQQPDETDAPQEGEKPENGEAPRPAAQENPPRRPDMRPPRPRGDRPERPQRGDRSERPPRQERGERPPRPQRKPMDRQRPPLPRQNAPTENPQPPKADVQVIREEKMVDVLAIREDEQKQDLL